MFTHELPEHGTDWPILRERMERGRSDDRPWYGPRMFIGGSYFAREDVLRVANEALALYVNCNQLYAPRLFESLVRYESEVTEMLLGLLSAPSGAGGCITTGGTESLLLAVHAAVQRLREAGAAPPDVNIVVPHAAHPAFDKAAHLFGIECRRASGSRDYRAHVPEMSRLMDDNTALVAGSAPSYPFGVTDDIGALAEIARERGAWLHVDACHGGFVLPFARRLGYPVPDFDFSVPDVTSISVDVHKLGYSNKGVSALLLRDAALARLHRYGFDGWPAGRYETAAVAGSRSAGGLASAWAVLNYLGESGYMEIAGSILRARARLLDGLRALDDVQVRGEPDAYLVAFGCRGCDIFAVDEWLAERGWVENRLLAPPSVHLFLDGANRESIDAYLADLEDAMRTVRREGTRARDRNSSYAVIDR